MFSRILLDGPVTGMIPWPSGNLKGIYRKDLSKKHKEEIEEVYESLRANGDYNCQDGFDLNCKPKVKRHERTGNSFNGTSNFSHNNIRG